MTHKQVKFGKNKKSRKVKPVEEEYESGSASRRSLLLSSNDVDRMAEESSRARLINHLVGKFEDREHATREFASYYRGSTRHTEPPYSITSHTNKVYIPQAPQVIPTYQSLIQTPQWSPYIKQTPGRNSQTDLMMNRKYNCRCVECLSADCPARSSSTFRPRRMKDNIMTFCDQYTMTRNLNDASCGCTPTSSAFNCPGKNVPYETSMIGGRDQVKPKIYEITNKMGTYTPVPILKKGYTADPINKDSLKKFQDGQNKIEPPKSMSIECFFRKKEDDRTGCKSSRKNIYNEGISDVSLKIPSRPSRSRSRSPVTPVRARSRVTSSSECSNSDVNIPHSHRSESRYHKYCMEEPPRPFVLDDGMIGRVSKHRVLVSKPRSRGSISPCKICSGKRSKQQQRIIKLPKKLLTSEKLADASARKPKPPCRRK